MEHGHLVLVCVPMSDGVWPRRLWLSDFLLVITESTAPPMPKPKVYRMWDDYFQPKPNIYQKCSFAYIRRHYQNQTSVDH